MANIIIFSKAAVYTALLITLSGILNSPIIGTLARPMPTAPNPVLIETYEGEIDECAPIEQAEQNNTHDLACVLESIETTISYQLTSYRSLRCGSNDQIFYGNSFPALYQAMVETLSALDQAEVTAHNLNESMCILKRLAATGLNTTVKNHCSCSGSEECALNAVTLDGSNEGSEPEHDETCLLVNLQRILTSIQTDLGGSSVTCRRASNTQQQILVDFESDILDYHRFVAPPEILGSIRLPLSPCLYRGSDLSTHIKSFYSLAPYLNNLTSCEAQEISRNITEIVFPVIKQLLGDVYVEQIINTAQPFSTQQETSFGLLNEHGQTICLVERLNTIYIRFMSVLRQENVDIISEHCISH